MTREDIAKVNARITEIIGEVGTTYNVGDVIGYIEEED